METRITPDLIEVLEENQIFVFGSNTSGKHGRGAAKTALGWGAGLWTPRQNLYGKNTLGQEYKAAYKELSTYEMMEPKTIHHVTDL